MASALGILWNILEQSKLLFGLEARQVFSVFASVNEVIGLPPLNFVHSDIIVSQPFTIIHTTENDH